MTLGPMTWRHVHPSRRALPVLVVALASSLASCGGDAETVSGTLPPWADRIVRDIDVIDGTTATAFLPDEASTGGEPTPTVVMFHGTQAEPERMEPLARAVADAGALVFVPKWPVIDQAAPYPEDEEGEPYLRQSESAVCTLRHARLVAEDYGGDPDDLTVVGYSGGGMIGARVSLVDEPPWPGITCDVEIDHAPDRFVGIAGDYRGWYQYSQQYSEWYAPYDVFGLEPTNDDLEVRLLHGHGDQAVELRDAVDLSDHLAEAGIGAPLVVTDLAHSANLQTDEPGGAFLAEQITAIVHDDEGPIWSEMTTPAGTLAFARDGACTYDGPNAWATGEPLDVELIDAADVDADLFVLTVRADDPPADDWLMAQSQLVDDAPGWVDAYGWVHVGAGGERTVRLVFVEGDQSLLLACHPDPYSDHPFANWMLAAGVLHPTESTATNTAEEVRS